MQEVKLVDAGEELYLSTSRTLVLADAKALLTRQQLQCVNWQQNVAPMRAGG